MNMDQGGSDDWKQDTEARQQIPHLLPVCPSQIQWDQTQTSTAIATERPLAK
jgi:hypothetical protein